jgi:hypothetical protein
MDLETLNIRYQKSALTHARQFLSRQNERKHADVWFALDCLSLCVSVLSSTREEERYCSLSLSLSFGIGKTVVKLGEFNNNFINIESTSIGDRKRRI